MSKIGAAPLDATLHIRREVRLRVAEFNSVWVGDRLLPIANACINSFRGHGHQFALYTYNNVEDVPEFVERRSAEEMVPHSQVFLAHGGWETFADRFAYEFLYRNGGWWVDSDIVCNADLVPDIEIGFAEEDIGIINNAVLKFPRKHPAIRDLLSYISTIDPVNSEWGATGPWALSKIFNRPELSLYKMKMADCYPFNWRDAPKLFFPEYTGEILERTQRSPFIHLWGAALREFDFDFKKHAPIEGSYLDLLYKKYLDLPIRLRLAPIQEALFRPSVREYMKKSWGIDLLIRT